MTTKQGAIRSLASLTGSVRHEGQDATAVPRPTSRWKTRILVPSAVLLAFGGLIAYAARSALVPAVEVRVVPVIARPAESANGALSAGAPVSSVLVQAPGWIEPDPFAITVPALVDGVVKEVLVLEGMAVEAGAVVVRLIDDDLRIANRASLALVSEKEADLVKARAAIASARAGVEAERASFDALQDEVTRKRELISAGSVGSAEVRRLELQLRGLEARVAQAESLVTEAEAAVTQAEAVLESARVAQAESALRLDRTEVRSPAKGVVLSRLVEPGSRIMMSSRSEMNGAGGVVRLYDPEKLQVRVDVPLADAAKIGLESAAEITTEAVPNQTFTGRVSRIVHEANIQRNTVQFKVSLENPSPLLKPEMLCRVKFRPAPPTSASDSSTASQGETDGLELLVSSQALFDRQANTATLWLVEGAVANGWRAVLKNVTVGEERGDDTIILSGVRPGDRAIVDPPGTLKPGRRVRVIGEALSPDRRTEDQP